jgi:hypothetical protein
MTTLRIRAPLMSHEWALPRLTRVVSFVGAVFDVFAEAQEMARVAHKRYPFAEG